MLKRIGKVLQIGGWAPLVVLATHLFLSRILNAYRVWPPTDIPVHFLGGVAIAFFISRCYQFLPRETKQRSRVVILEIVLILSLTATAAVFWEFQEFTRDQLFGSNIQVSLANTMQATVVALIRSRQLHVGIGELKEIARDWVRGYAA
jgi:predicted Kef-type K+ transport protein